MKNIFSHKYLILAFLLLARAGFADTGLATRVSTQNRLPNSPLAIFMGDGVVESKDMASGDPYLYFFGINPVAGKKIYHGRAAYSVDISINDLNKGFFEDANRTQKLVGSNSKISLVAQSPFTFRSSTGGLFSVTSTTVMRVFERSDLEKNPDLLANIQKLSRRNELPNRVIVQKTNGFNMFINRAFMVTLLYASANTKTDIEVISSVLIDSTPPFLGMKPIRSAAVKNLNDYANNLSKERP